jgi:mitotic spindle assembly checkpoint protein MAD2
MFAFTNGSTCTAYSLDMESATPDEWEASEPRYIADGAEQVKLRSFNTSVHKVEGLVSYKANDD